MTRMTCNSTSSNSCPACGVAIGDRTTKLFGHTLLCCDSCGAWHWRDEGKPLPDYNDVYETPDYEFGQVAELESTANFQTFVNHASYAPFFSNVPRPAGGTLLDVGCGVGRFLRGAKTQGWNVRGIDVAQKAIEIGKRTADFPMSCESLEDLKRAGATFDAVTAFEVLEHVPEPLELIHETSSLIKPGGWFFCTTPNRECKSVLKTKKAGWLPPVHVNFYTPRSLQRLLERGGLLHVQTGLVYAGIRPTTPLYFARYLIRRLLRITAPEPVGIWAMGQRSVGATG